MAAAERTTLVNVSLRTRVVAGLSALLALVLATGLPSGGSATGSENLTYHGGEVIHTAAVYVIFWLPPGYHYELPGRGSDASFESLVTRYFSDVGGSSYYGILTQYSDSSGPIQNVSTLGGSFVDVASYGSSLASEVVRVAQLEGWPGGLGSLFMILTAPDVFQGNIYHSSIDQAGRHYVFGTFTNPYKCTSCGPDGYDPGLIASPNKDTTFDLALSGIAHEQFEAVSDPLGGGWTDPSGAEIADKCVGNAYATAAGGSNLVLHSHEYFTSMMWSNAAGACALSYAGPTATPTLTALSTATFTPVPTATVTATALPPTVAIDQVQFLHTVRGRWRTTRTLHQKDHADFLVLYHIVNAASFHPLATLRLTKNGKTVGTYAMRAERYQGHQAFHKSLLFHQGTGAFFAHFRVALGAAIATRNRRFTVKP